MPTTNNYDPRSGKAGSNYGGGRTSSGGFGSGSGMGSSGAGFGSGGFGSQGSMGNGANVGQGFGNIDQSHGGTFGTGGLMGTGFNTRTTDGGQTRIGSDMNGNPIYQQGFNVLPGASGTPGGSPSGQIGIGGSVPSYIPGYGGGVPFNNAGNSAQPNYQGGYGGQTGGGYTGGYDPATDPAYMAAMTASAGNPGGGIYSRQNDIYGRQNGGMGPDPSGGSGTGGTYGMSTELMEHNARIAGNTPESLAQERSGRQQSQNQSHIDGLPMDQNANERTAQGLGYSSYQAYLNANPGQVMPGAQGIPGQNTQSGQGQQQGGNQGYQSGPGYQPSQGYQPSYGPGGYYDPATQTDYTGGWGGGPSQYEQAMQASANPRGMATSYQTPGMFDAYNAQNGISSQPQQGGATGYAPQGSGRSGARGQIDSNGNDITPGMNGNPSTESKLNKSRSTGGAKNQATGGVNPVLKRASADNSGKQRQTVNPFETYAGETDGGSGQLGGVFEGTYQGGNNRPQTVQQGVSQAPPNQQSQPLGPWSHRDERGNVVFTCFVAGTPIATTEGETSIEDVSVGDKVLAFNHDERTEVEAVVTDTLRSESDETYKVKIGGTVLEVTGEHPFWNVTHQDYVPVKDLSAGMVVRLKGGATQVIDEITSEKHDSTVTVYNITVDAQHNYFADGVLVHNKSVQQGFKPQITSGPDFDPNGERYQTYNPQGGGQGDPYGDVYGGSNSPMGTHGQTGEQIMAPGGGGKPPWMGPNPTQPYPEGNMTPFHPPGYPTGGGYNPFGAVERPPMTYPNGQQPIEGGIDMNWLGQDGRYLTPQGAGPSQNPFETYAGGGAIDQNGQQSNGAMIREGQAPPPSAGPQVMGDMTQEYHQQILAGQHPNVQRGPSGAWGTQGSNGQWAIY